MNDFAWSTVFGPRRMTFLVTLPPTAQSVNTTLNYNLCILPTRPTTQIMVRMSGRFSSTLPHKPVALLTLP